MSVALSTIKTTFSWWAAAAIECWSRSGWRRRRRYVVLSTREIRACRLSFARPCPRQLTALLGCAMRNRPALARDRRRTRYSFRNDFERMRKADCSVACYTGLERCPAYSGSLVLVLAPLSLQLNSGAIYFSRHEPFASLPSHQDEPDDSDDDQEYLACRDYRLSVHGQPPLSRSCPSAAKHLVRDSSVRGQKPTGPEGPLQVNFRNREKACLICGTATVLAQLAPDEWHCHDSPAVGARCAPAPYLSSMRSRTRSMTSCLECTPSFA